MPSRSTRGDAGRRSPLCRWLPRQEGRRGRRRSSPSTWRRCCCRRFSARSAPTALLYPRQQAAIVPKISAPIKKVYVERGARSAPASCSSSSRTGDLRAPPREPRGAASCRGDLRDHREGDGAGGAAEGGARRAGRAKTRSTPQQAVYDNRQRLFKEGAIAQKDVNDAQVDSHPGAQPVRDGAKAPRGSAGLRQRSGAQGGRGAARRRRRRAAMRRRRSSATRASPARSTASSPTGRSMPARRAPSGSPIVTVMDLSQVIARAHISPARSGGAEGRQRREPHRRRTARRFRQGDADQPGARRREHDRRSLGAGRQPGRHAEARHQRACRDDREDRAERAGHSAGGAC